MQGAKDSSLFKSIMETAALVEGGKVDPSALDSYLHIGGETGAIITKASVRGKQYAHDISNGMGNSPFNLLGAPSSGSASGDRYDRRDGGFSLGAAGSNPVVAAAAQQAQQSGIAWAQNKPDLLALGPEAIKALATANLSQFNYDSLIQNAGFKPAGVVALAEYATLNGENANDLSKFTVQTVQALAGNDRTKRNDPADAFTNYYAARTPEEKAASSKRMNELLDREEQANPQHKKLIDRTRAKLKLKRETLDRTNAASDAERAQTAGDQVKAGDEKTKTGEEKIKTAEQKEVTEVNLAKSDRMADALANISPPAADRPTTPTKHTGLDTGVSPT